MKEKDRQSMDSLTQETTTTADGSENQKATESEGQAQEASKLGEFIAAELKDTLQEKLKEEAAQESLLQVVTTHSETIINAVQKGLEAVTDISDSIRPAITAIADRAIRTLQLWAEQIEQANKEIEAFTSTGTWHEIKDLFTDAEQWLETAREFDALYAANVIAALNDIMPEVRQYAAEHTEPVTLEALMSEKELEALKTDIDGTFQALADKAGKWKAEAEQQETDSASPAHVSQAISNCDRLLEATFLPLLNNTVTNEFPKISKKDFKANTYTHTATAITGKGIKTIAKNFDKLRNSLGTSANKILDAAVIYLTYNNVYNASTINPIVEIPLIEYGKLTKHYELEPQIMETEAEQAAENKRAANKLKEFKKSVRADLTDIKSLEFSYTETKGRNKGDYVDMGIISNHSIRTINGVPVIRIAFDVDAASYLVKSYVMQFPTVLFGIDNRNPNAYSIGRYIALHNSMDNNVAAGTANTLSVKKLLEAAPEIISIEQLREGGQRNWKEKIKQRLETAINTNMEIGYIIRWEYRDRRTEDRYTPDMAETLTWDSYYNLMIDFTLMDNPQQTERQERKEKEKAEKAIAETEKLKAPVKKKRGRPKSKPQNIT